MPISYKLRLICDVIDDAGVQSNCQRALEPEEYCTKRLQEGRGDVTDCSEISDSLCVWTSDCEVAQECRENTCESFADHVLPVFRYWDERTGAYTYHFEPAWDREHDCTSYSCPDEAPSPDVHTSMRWTRQSLEPYRSTSIVSLVKERTIRFIYTMIGRTRTTVVTPSSTRSRSKSPARWRSGIIGTTEYHHSILSLSGPARN